MNRLLDPYADENDVSHIHDEASIDEWTLDELERTSDLESVRSAWIGQDDPIE